MSLSARVRVITAHVSYERLVERADQVERLRVEIHQLYDRVVALESSQARARRPREIG